MYRVKKERIFILNKGVQYSRAARSSKEKRPRRLPRSRRSNNPKTGDGGTDASFHQDVSYLGPYWPKSLYSNKKYSRWNLIRKYNLISVIYRALHYFYILPTIHYYLQSYLIVSYFITLFY